MTDTHVCPIAQVRIDKLLDEVARLRLLLDETMRANVVLRKGRS